jgi:hypothetical protein
MPDILKIIAFLLGILIVVPFGLVLFVNYLIYVDVVVRRWFRL